MVAEPMNVNGNSNGHGDRNDDDFGRVGDNNGGCWLLVGASVVCH